MNKAKTRPPVILVLDGKEDQNAALKQWLDQSRFRTWEAVDVFGMLEQLSDFTVRRRPDVVFLEADSIADDLSLIRECVQSGNAPEYPIFAWATAAKSPDSHDCFVGSLEQVEAQLNKAIPADPHFLTRV